METIPAYLDAAGLAQLFGMTTRSILQFTTDGVLHREKGGLFEVRRSIANYVHYRAVPKNKETAENLRAEKLKAETEHIQLKTAVAKGDLLDAQQVKSEWAQAGSDLRSSILAIPSRVGATLGLDRAQVAAIDLELRECLGAIAEAFTAAPENPSAAPEGPPEPAESPEPTRPSRRDLVGDRTPLPESPAAADSRRRAARKAARAARRVARLPA